MARTADSGKPAAGTAVTTAPRFERQRARILDAATVLLNQRGVAGTTLRLVADQLGFKATAVTYYFRFKEQLVVAVFADTLDRLAAMVEEAGRADTPRERADRYLKLHFDHYAAVARGEERPLAILSEIRTIEGEAGVHLVSRFQEIFRAVRSFFGPTDTPALKQKYTARAQLLNEAIFWSAVWLQQHEIADFENVRRQMFRIFDGGIAASPIDAQSIPILTPPAESNDGFAPFLKIATRSLNENGYKGTSIKNIAAELNVTKGSFYHHLDTKDDLILECFRSSYRRLWQLYDQAVSNQFTRWQTLIAIIATAIHFQFDGEYPLLRTTAYQALPESGRGIPYEHSQRTALFLSGLIVDSFAEGAARDINPLLAGHVIMSTINAAFDIRNWAARQEPQEAVANYMRGITEGIFDPA